MYVLADTSRWTIDTSGQVPIRSGGSEASLPRLAAAFMELMSPNLAGALNPGTDSLARRGRSAILVAEWGPYDWRSPLLWPRDSSRANPLTLRVLGPAGRWRVVGRRGVARVSRESGSLSALGTDSIVVTPAKGSENDWDLTLEHVRGAGTRQPATRFSYRRFEPAIDWNVRFFTWRDSTEDPPVNADAFAALLRGTPALTRQAPRLDYMWYRPTIAGVSQERFAISAI